MQSKAKTVDAYLKELPADRREALKAIRAVILKNLPKGYEEGMQYGMMGYYVPHSVYASGYHCDPSQPVPFASVASQKNHMALYLMCVYGDEKHRTWFIDAWKKSGKKLDMGKSCVRFKKLEDVPLDVLGKAIARVPVKQYLAFYESVLASSTSKKKTTTKKKKAPSKKTSKKTTRKAASKKTAKKSASKKTASKKTVKKAVGKKATTRKKSTKKTAQKTAKKRTTKR